MLLSCTEGDAYSISEISGILTPALAIYSAALDHNIAAMLKLMDTGERWRPHVKTAKLAFTMRRLVQHGVMNMKCATTLELRTACEAGAKDVLVAYSLNGRAITRACEIARQFPAVRTSALVENPVQVEAYRGSNVGLFVDINPGMNRTGVELHRTDEIAAIVRAIAGAGLEFRGLHYYEGHHKETILAERVKAAHAGYDKLMRVIAALERSGHALPEVITSGTPALPCALAYAGFKSGSFLHRVSPGTVVYNDCTSLGQLPPDYGLMAAALVITTVVSRPRQGLITCDAGHKTVSADAGVPGCCVHRHPYLHPLGPSEEHLPMEVAEGAVAPEIGERLYLVPRHVCPTVNNFDLALIVTDGRISGIERVTARGREAPLATLAAQKS